MPRAACVLLAIAFAAVCAVEDCAAAAWRIQRLGGRDYLPLSQVAQFYGMRVVPRGDRGVSLVSGDRSMEFSSGSREARIDKVKHWLSFPLLYFAGEFYVSRMDLSKTLDPLMRPQRIPKLEPFRTVVLDPGHGGHDRGAVNSYAPEKHYNLDIARRVRAYLQDAGFRVVITRSGDGFIPLEARPAVATRFQREDKGTVFVSIHCNAAGQRGSLATGFEVFTMTPRGAPNSHDAFLTRRSFSGEPGHMADHASHALATAIQHAMLGRVPLLDRGVKRARFAVLRRATTPAVLVECGFMSNPRDARLLHSAEWRERLAESIAQGILEYAALAKTKKPPKLLAAYRAEQQEMPHAADYEPLAGIGAAVPAGVAGAHGWRGLLSAPLGMEPPSFRLEFEPSGWVQLEAWASAEDDARAAATNEQDSLMQQGEWPEPPPPFPGLGNWRSLLPPRGLDRGFELFPPSGGPEAGGDGEEAGAHAAGHEGGRTAASAPVGIIEISGGAL